jgi:multidrug efflux pump subunit AcrB
VTTQDFVGVGSHIVTKGEGGRQKVWWDAVIGATIALFSASVWGASKLEDQFFPASDRPELVLSISLPQNASL